MIGPGALKRMEDERGPRYLVHGTIRPREYAVHYADTAEQAEVWRTALEEQRHRQVRVIPPDGSIDLGALAGKRRQAKEAFDEATAVLRAGVLRALEDGRSEVEVARVAEVDRMTVRSWQGKGKNTNG